MISLTLFLLFFIGHLASASVLTHTQNLFIVKYALKKDVKSVSSATNAVTINQLPVDDESSELVALAGVHYVIQKIAPLKVSTALLINDTSTYQLLGHSTEIVTDTQGVAEINLTDGFYIVSEQVEKSDELNQPAPPLLLELPTSNRTQTTNEGDVYIYPKSSINEKENEGENVVNPYMTKQSSEKGQIKENLPKTSSKPEKKLLVFGFVLMDFSLYLVCYSNLRRNEA